MDIAPLIRRLVPPVVALGALACATRPRDPILDSYPRDVIGQTTVSYYDIHGRTIAELRGDMRKQGPKLNDTSFVGETRSPMRWDWQTRAEGTSACSIKRVHVYVNAQILLPRWTPPADTEPGLYDEWKRFMAALATHEAGHKDISGKAGAEIIKKLSELSGSCAFIGGQAQDITRGIMQRASDEQRRYDAETRHGLTQGTSFGLRPGAFAFPRNGAVLVPRQGAVRAPLAVSVELAWRALPAAFRAVGLTVNTIDSASHAVGFIGTVKDTIGDTPLSAYVDCPPSPTDVSLSIAAQVVPDSSGGSVFMTVPYATVKSAAGATIVCRANAMLGRQILQALRAEVGR